jgi:protein-arginine kinase activator protein McsA
MNAADPTGTSCSMCGTTVAERPMTWMLETDSRRGSVWVCDSCARENLRAIESKLDQAWW